MKDDNNSLSYIHYMDITSMFERFESMCDTKASVSKPFYIYFEENNKSIDSIFVNFGDTVFFNQNGDILCVFKKHNVSENIKDYQIIKRQIDNNVIDAKNIRGIMVVF